MAASETRALIERYVGAHNHFDMPGMLPALHPFVEFRNAAAG
jgi:hypothetical protein